MGRGKKIFKDEFGKNCSKCKNYNLYDDFSKNKSTKDGHHHICKKCHNDNYKENRIKIIEYQAQHRKKDETQQRLGVYWRSQKHKDDNKRKRIELKIKAFDSYGGAICSCCGETELCFLDIDHIHGSGHQHRKQLNGTNIYQWLKNNGYPEGFRVLCRNCNWGVYMNNGICPHKIV